MQTTVAGGGGLRAVEPAGRHIHDPYDEWPLRALLRCLACRRWMIPIRWADQAGTRADSCGSRCSQRDLVAAEIEDHLALAALVRGAVVAIRCDGARPPVTAEEWDRWRATDVFDRRAVMLAAFVWGFAGIV